MLKSLTIQNYALIESLKMAPSDKLNIITGETGAGKSIMLGAVGLMLGKRADIKALLNEEKKCIVEGIFDLSNYDLQQVFEEEDLDYEIQSIIRREISPSGKSRAFINDTPVTLDTLRKIGVFLMDVHSQHDSLMLSSSSFQLQIVDAFAANPDLLKNYRQAYLSYKKAKKSYDQLLSDATEQQKSLDYNSFLLEELVTAQLQAEEQSELEEELEVLENSEEIKLRLNNASQALLNADSSAVSLLYETSTGLKAINKFSHKYENLSQRLESCLIELKDIAREVESEEEQVSFDPEKIQETKDRLSLIYQLQQKHHVHTVSELLSLQEELQVKVDKVLHLDDEIASAKLALETSEKRVFDLGQELTNERKKVFELIEAEILELLQSLGMPDASFTIVHEQTSPTNTGMDEVNFLFSANKGIKPQLIKNAASGGEFSRLMFCIKYILADKTALPTIVFDEIDTGISGEIALKMVSMMKRMADNHQVIVISHLPQIAAKGDTHYFVYKDNSSVKTISKVRELSGEERISEIAKMIGGESPSPVAYESARELMRM